MCWMIQFVTLAGEKTIPIRSYEYIRYHDHPEVIGKNDRIYESIH